MINEYMTSSLVPKLEMFKSADMTEVQHQMGDCEFDTISYCPNPLYSSMLPPINSFYLLDFFIYWILFNGNLTHFSVIPTLVLLMLPPRHKVGMRVL